MDSRILKTEENETAFSHLAYISSLKMEAAGFSEMLAPIYEITSRHIVQDSNVSKLLSRKSEISLLTLVPSIRGQLEAESYALEQLKLI
jgi:hypothetical protein